MRSIVRNIEMNKFEDYYFTSITSFIRGDYDQIVLIYILLKLIENGPSTVKQIVNYVQQAPECISSYLLEVSESARYNEKTVEIFIKEHNDVLIFNTVEKVETLMVDTVKPCDIQHMMLMLYILCLVYEQNGSCLSRLENIVNIKYKFLSSQLNIDLEDINALIECISKQWATFFEYSSERDSLQIKFRIGTYLMNSHSINNGIGSIEELYERFGIISHHYERVYFDLQCKIKDGKNVTKNLLKHFFIGQKVIFDAFIEPKSFNNKWKATCINNWTVDNKIDIETKQGRNIKLQHSVQELCNAVLTVEHIIAVVEKNGGQCNFKNIMKDKTADFIRAQMKIRKCDLKDFIVLYPNIFLFNNKNNVVSLLTDSAINQTESAIKALGAILLLEQSMKLNRLVGKMSNMSERTRTAMGGCSSKSILNLANNSHQYFTVCNEVVNVNKETMLQLLRSQTYLHVSNNKISEVICKNSFSQCCSETFTDADDIIENQSEYDDSSSLCEVNVLEYKISTCIDDLVVNNFDEKLCGTISVTYATECIAVDYYWTLLENFNECSLMDMLQCSYMCFCPINILVGPYEENMLQFVMQHKKQFVCNIEAGTVCAVEFAEWAKDDADFYSIQYLKALFTLKTDMYMEELLEIVRASSNCIKNTIGTMRQDIVAFFNWSKTCGNDLVLCGFKSNFNSIEDWNVESNQWTRNEDDNTVTENNTVESIMPKNECEIGCENLLKDMYLSFPSGKSLQDTKSLEHTNNAICCLVDTSQSSNPETYKQLKPIDDVLHIMGSGVINYVSKYFGFIRDDENRFLDNLYFTCAAFKNENTDAEASKFELCRYLSVGSKVFFKAEKRAKWIATDVWQSKIVMEINDSKLFDQTDFTEKKLNMDKQLKMELTCVEKMVVKSATTISKVNSASSVISANIIQSTINEILSTSAEVSIANTTQSTTNEVLSIPAEVSIANTTQSTINLSTPDEVNIANTTQSTINLSTPDEVSIANTTQSTINLSTPDEVNIANTTQSTINLSTPDEVSIANTTQSTINLSTPDEVNIANTTQSTINLSTPDEVSIANTTQSTINLSTPDEVSIANTTQSTINLSTPDEVSIANTTQSTINLSTPDEVSIANTTQSTINLSTPDEVSIANTTQSTINEVLSTQSIPVLVNIANSFQSTVNEDISTSALANIAFSAPSIRSDIILSPASLNAINTLQLPVNNQNLNFISDIVSFDEDEITLKMDCNEIAISGKHAHVASDVNVIKDLHMVSDQVVQHTLDTVNNNNEENLTELFGTSNFSEKFEPATYDITESSDGTDKALDTFKGQVVHISAELAKIEREGDKNLININLNCLLLEDMCDCNNMQNHLLLKDIVCVQIISKLVEKESNTIRVTRMSDCFIHSNTKPLHAHQNYNISSRTSVKWAVGRICLVHREIIAVLFGSCNIGCWANNDHFNIMEYCLGGIVVFDAFKNDNFAEWEVTKVRNICCPKQTKVLTKIKSNYKIHSERTACKLKINRASQSSESEDDKICFFLMTVIFYCLLWFSWSF